MVESKTSAIAAFLGVLTFLEEFQDHCCADVTILGLKTVPRCPFLGVKWPMMVKWRQFPDCPVKNFCAAPIND
jgi:hypothetical protein